MLLRRLTGLLVVVALSALAGVAHAEGSALQRNTKAEKLVKFEGKLINLANGWGEARACVIWEQAQASECFRTEAAMAQHIARVEQARSSDMSIMAACSSALHLYEHSNFGGRHLRFFDRGYWQNLSAWGFNDELSSYKVGACGVHLAEHSNGGGYWYPGSTSAGSQSSCMCAGSTNWNDRVSSIYIR